jgi:hypothetical protein
LARLKSAIKHARKLYVGDGFHSDNGPKMRFDYYSSIVITPGLWDILETAEACGVKQPQHFLDDIRKQTVRQAEILESFISPEGTFPIMGRSAAYRAAGFHTLAFAAWKGILPEETLPLGAVRNALTSILERTLNPDSFDHEGGGWLLPGITAHQPRTSEAYIHTGSLYMCLLPFATLGLPINDPFWTKESENWSQKKLWNGEDYRGGRPLYEPVIYPWESGKAFLRKVIRKLLGKKDVPLEINPHSKNDG